MYEVVGTLWQTRMDAGESLQCGPPGVDQVELAHHISQAHRYVPDASLCDPEEWSTWLGLARQNHGLANAILAGDWIAAQRCLPDFALRLIQDVRQVVASAEKAQRWDLRQTAIELLSSLMELMQLHAAFRATCGRVSLERLLVATGDCLEISQDALIARLGMVELDPDDFLNAEAGVGPRVFRSAKLRRLIDDVFSDTLRPT